MFQDSIRQEIPKELEATFLEGRSVLRWTRRMREALQGLAQVRRHFDGKSIGYEDVANGITLILDRVKLNLPYAVCKDCTKLPSCPCSGKGWFTASEFACRRRDRTVRRVKPISDRDLLRMELDSVLSES